MDMGQRGVEREAKYSITPGDARTFANPTLVDLYSSYICKFVWFGLVAVGSVCFLLAIYRRWIQYRVCACFYFGAANPSQCFSLYQYTSFFYLICCPSFPPPSFLFRCVMHLLSLSLPSCLGCLALLMWLPFLRSLLRGMDVFFALRVLYVVVLCFYIFTLLVFCFLEFSSESLPGDDVLCRLISRPLPSVCFPCMFVCCSFVFSPTLCSFLFCFV